MIQTRKLNVIYKKSLKFYDDADIYDAINFSEHDADFWKKFCGKNGKSVLELCCGTGRIAIPLIEAGFDYTGVDLSLPFLRHAEKKIVANGARGTYSFEVQDMRQLNLAKEFDTIFIPFNSFLHLCHFKDAEKCLLSVRKHLKKNGVFILAVFNPNPSFHVLDPQERNVKGHFQTKSGTSFIWETASFYDRATQINYGKYYFHIDGQSKPIVRELIIKMYYPQELDMLLHYNGFKIIQKFGDFDESPFVSSSRWQIVLSKKNDA